MKRGLTRTALCLLAAAIGLSAFLAACGGASQAPDGGDTPAAESADDFYWDVQLLQTQVVTSLSGTAYIKQYDGTMLEVDNSLAPQEGMAYLLVQLQISKTQTGGRAFSWAELLFLPAEGEAGATRLADDTFLETYGYTRLPGTDLRIGENTGWIAFEVPLDAIQAGASLAYQGTAPALVWGLDL